jgi:hypothetical protein
MMMSTAVFGTGLLGGTYCAVEDVQALLAGWDLSAVGDSGAIEARIEDLLPQTKAIIDALAGRDFELHEGQSILLDGSGHDTLFLRQHGYHPVVAVAAVEIEGVLLDDEDWMLYPAEGFIRLTNRDAGDIYRGRSRRVFPAGVKNVRVTLTWGFPGAPAHVRLAQAKLTAIELLAQASVAVGGGASRVTLGDYTVEYGSESAYAGTIRRWEADVRAWAGMQRGARVVAA